MLLTLPQLFETYTTSCIMLVIHTVLVPMAGLEPAQLSPPPPQDGVSTNSTTSATITLTIALTIAFTNSRVSVIVLALDQPQHHRSV